MNVDLSGAVLSGTDLTGANLSGAQLSGADLTGAILCDAALVGAKLDNVDLSKADLAGAKMGRTIDDLDPDIQVVLKSHKLWIDSFGVIDLIEKLERQFDMRFANTQLQDRRFPTITGLAEILDEISRG